MKTNFQKMSEAIEREGDPDDDLLNKVEEEFVLPRIEENRVKSVYCKAEREALEECSKKYGVAFSFMCFFDKVFYADCVTTRKSSDDVKDDCLEEYLALRSKYRLTKDPKTLNRIKSMVFPHKFKPDES